MHQYTYKILCHYVMLWLLNNSVLKVPYNYYLYKLHGTFKTWENN